MTYQDLTVSVGDTLVFYFVAEIHDVHVFDLMHHLDWASCNFPTTTNDIDGIYELPSVVTTHTIDLGIGTLLPINQGNYTFNETTIVYFACGGGGGTHCFDGQKFEVKVLPKKKNDIPKVWHPQYQKIPTWTLLGYPDLKVSRGDKLIFKFDPVTTQHDVWIMDKPCTLQGATQIANVSDGAGQGFYWSATCPNGRYPCSLFLGCSCRPVGALGMSSEGCGLGAGSGPLLHCLSGMGFNVNITHH